MIKKIALSLPSLKLVSRADPETEFLPAALEIVETPASPVGRAIAFTIILFFIIALAWASFGTVDIITTAQGRIVPTGRTKIIQPFETGVVRAIHVRDGQQVKAGDVLIEIDPTINDSERSRLTQDLIRENLDVARLKAVVSGAADPIAVFVPPPDASADQVALQRRLLANQLDEMHAKLNGLDKQIAQSQGNLAAVTSTIGKLTEAIPLLKRRYDMRHELAEKGYSSKLEALSRTVLLSVPARRGVSGRKPWDCWWRWLRKRSTRTWFCTTLSLVPVRRDTNGR